MIKVNGKGQEIFKDPVTDSGVKKSARGLLKVTNDFKLVDRVSWEGEEEGQLKTVFVNGRLSYEQASFEAIRGRLKEYTDA